MSDNPYAQFGVHNAVLTSDTLEDHRQNMLEQDVAVRDGDDEIQLQASDESSNVIVTDLVDDELGTEDRITVNIDTEGEAQDPVEDPEGDPAAEGGEALEGDFEALGDAPDDLVAASKQITEYADGFEQMQAQAVERGLPVEVAAQIRAEYEGDGNLSEESLKALEEAGYSRGFVQAYISGQESIAAQYVSQVMEYAGGKDAFNKIVSHMQANSPETLEVLEDAIQRQDIKAIKSTINLAMAARTQKFGKAPNRSVTARAPAVAAQRATPKVEGFANTNAMVAAMSDPRYGRDAAYRASVVAKVHASTF